jgi:chromate transporter
MFWILFTTFFKIGLFTIGGGYAMIPMIEREVVRNRKWITDKDFLDLMAIAQSAPGVFAVNISIFIGYRVRKVWGSIFCALGTTLPSIIIILLIALFFQQFKENSIVENVFKGIRPAVVALILTPTLNLAKVAGLNKYTIWVPIVTALLIWMLGVSPIYIIIFAIIGAVVYYNKKIRRKI